MLTSGIVDVCTPSTCGGRCLVLPVCPSGWLVWNVPVVVGVGPACDGWVARCWALRDQALVPDGAVTLVFLWLFGCWIVDASIFVAVCSDQFL